MVGERAPSNNNQNSEPSAWDSLEGQNSGDVPGMALQPANGGGGGEKLPVETGGESKDKYELMVLQKDRGRKALEVVKEETALAVTGDNSVGAGGKAQEGLTAPEVRNQNGLSADVNRGAEPASDVIYAGDGGYSERKMIEGPVAEEPAPEGKEDGQETAGEQRGRREWRMKGPLTAVNADFSFDAEQLAHVEANEAINRETTGKGKFFGKLWKKTLFKKYYENKYTKEIMRGDRKIEVPEMGGQEMSVSEILERQKDSTIQRFVMAAVTGDRKNFLSEEIGGQQGETLVEADQETFEKVKKEIEWFAQAKIPEGKNLEVLKSEFRNRMGFDQSQANDEGKPVDEVAFNNYLDVAIQAREAVEHNVAMEDVMRGFKVYEAEARSGFKTAEHRDAVDKIVNNLEKWTFGLVPEQALIVAASVMPAIVETGARTIAKTAGVVGGFVANGVISGLKERNRITEDRAHMLRNASVNREYTGTSEAMNAEEGGKSNKQEKYEAKIGETLYHLEKATDLTKDILRAMQKPGKQGINVIATIAAAQARIEISDGEAKDLIAFSSADKRGDEYLALLTTIHMAEKSLSPQGKELLDVAKKDISEKILNDVNEKDKNFQHKRAMMAMAKGAKTAALGAITYFGSQEVMAAISPDKVGLLDKMLNRQNNAGANQTVLASLMGPNAQAETVVLDGSQVAERDALKAAGYTEMETVPASSQVQQTVSNVPVGQSTSGMKYDIVGWANNQTVNPDQNELKLWGDSTNGFTSMLSGNSTMPDGSPINYAQELAQGKIEVVMRINGTAFKIQPQVDQAGHLIFGQNGDFTTTSGAVLKGVGNSFDSIHIIDKVSETQGISLATELGDGGFAGTVQEVVESVQETPAQFTLTPPNGPTMFGGFAMPDWPRQGLGATRPGPSEPERMPPRRRPRRPRRPERPGSPAGNGPDGLENPLVPVSPNVPVPVTPPNTELSVATNEPETPVTQGEASPDNTSPNVEAMPVNALVTESPERADFMRIMNNMRNELEGVGVRLLDTRREREPDGRFHYSVLGVDQDGNQHVVGEGINTTPDATFLDMLNSVKAWIDRRKQTQNPESMTDGYMQRAA